MAESNRFPFWIWLSFVYLSIVLLLQLLGLYRNYSTFLAMGAEGIGQLVLQGVTTAVSFAVLVAIRERFRWARICGIILFSLLSAFAIQNAFLLFNWPKESSKYLPFAETMSVVRVSFSVLLVFAFIFSKTVVSYFSAAEDRFNDSPPPPPVFND